MSGRPIYDIGREATPRTYTASLTSDGTGAASAAVTITDPGWLRYAEVVPATGGDAPSAFTTLTVENARGTDLLSGGGAGAAVNANSIKDCDWPVWTGASVTVKATGMGDSNKATVYLVVTG